MDKKTTSIGVIIVTILAIVSIPLIPSSLFDSYGLLVLLVPFGIIACAVVVAFVLINKKTKLEQLQEKRKKVIYELEEAEKQFLQHKIDKKTFDSHSEEKNAELIRLEAEIDATKKNDLTVEEIKKADSVSSDKKRILLALLEQKHIKVSEIKIAEQSYLKRKIDEDSFQKISGDIKKEIISIDSQVKSIFESEEIAKLKEQLKQGAKEIKKQIKSTQNRDLDPMDEMEEELFEQSRA